jgi:hypothetical protein
MPSKIESQPSPLRFLGYKDVRKKKKLSGNEQLIEKYFQGI